MGSMSLMDVGIYTVEDLHAYREQRDDFVIQLIDGELVMTPGPSVPHQVVHSEVFGILREAVPDNLRVFSAPLDLRAGERTVIQPDLMVVDRDVRTGSEVVRAPPLVVEILSPSSRRTDLVRKPEALARFGVEHYWVIDPEHPAIREFRLVDGRYVTAQIVEGEDLFSTDAPFPVSFRPLDLTR